MIKNSVLDAEITPYFDTIIQPADAINPIIYFTSLFHQKANEAWEDIPT